MGFMANEGHLYGVNVYQGHLCGFMPNEGHLCGVHDYRGVPVRGSWLSRGTCVGFMVIEGYL